MYVITARTNNYVAGLNTGRFMNIVHLTGFSVPGCLWQQITVCYSKNKSQLNLFRFFKDMRRINDPF